MRLSGENRVFAILVVFVPATLVSSWLKWPLSVQFFLSVAAVMPLAGLIGSATEELANRLGARTGGLLNATFGNAPDFLVGFFGVQRGLIPLVKATLIGALVSNSALIMGLCYISAGLIHGKPKFRRAEAGHHSVLMLLTVAAVLFPSAGAMAICGGTQCTEGVAARQVQVLSIGISAALLVAYVGYIVFSVFGVESWRRPKVAATRRKVAAGTWPTWLSVSVLVAATVLLIPVVDILTGTVGAVTKVLGWTDVFVGIVIVANAGKCGRGLRGDQRSHPASREPRWRGRGLGSRPCPRHRLRLLDPDRHLHPANGRPVEPALQPDDARLRVGRDRHPRADGPGLQLHRPRWREQLVGGPPAGRPIRNGGDRHLCPAIDCV